MTTVEVLFLQCAEDLLPCNQAITPLNKMMDRSITNSATVSTLWWWSVAGNRCKSLEEIDGQVNNGRSDCFYFATMIRCRNQVEVLQGDWWTGQERKEWLFLICDDDVLLLIDLCSLSKLMEKSTTEGVTVSTMQWWCVAPDCSVLFQSIDGLLENWDHPLFQLCNNDILS